MNHSWISRRSPIVFFYLLIGVLVLAMGYSRLVRRLSLARELRYIPRENALLLATGDLDSLWRATEFQLHEALQAPKGAGILAAQIREWKRNLAPGDLPV